MGQHYYDLKDRLHREEDRLSRLEHEIAVMQRELRDYEIEINDANDQADRLDSIIRQFQSSPGRHELEVKLNKAEDRCRFYKDKAYRARNRLGRLEDHAEECENIIDAVHADMRRARDRMAAEREQRDRYEEAAEREEHARFEERIPSWARPQPKSSTNARSDPKGRSRPKAPSQPFSRTHPPQKAQPVTMADIKKWRDTTEVCFKDYSSIKDFPTPPGGTCHKAAWQANASSRSLKVCECNIRTAFLRLDINLKKERIRWHPDKFASTGLGDKAQEVFVVLNKMHKEEKGEDDGVSDWRGE